MKIFSPSQSNSPKENSAVKKNVKGRHHAAPLKKEVSDEEIRKKLAKKILK